MQNRDWIEKSYEGLENQVGLTWGYLSIEDYMMRMGLTGASTWLNTRFQPVMEAYGTAVTAWRDPGTRTPLAVKTLQDAHTALVPEYRHLYTGFLRSNPLVTSTDLEAMGLPPRSDDKPTPAPAPHTLVVVETQLPAPCVVEFHYRDSEKSTKGKPEMVHGAEFVMAILDEEPTDWSQLTTSHFSTASPLKVTFTGEQRGKKLYFAARWENTRGIKGSFSQIQYVIIP
ncbi:MAG: hypothetical protein LBT76_00740 [Tannerella sp.]|jgi:hypothetical protein|nr:hypothetical protein [Tannerella sp.]